MRMKDGEAGRHADRRLGRGGFSVSRRKVGWYRVI